MKKFWICLNYQLQAAVFKKSTLIITAITFLGILAVLAFIYWLGHDEQPHVVIMIHSDVFTVSPDMLQLEDVTISFESVADLEEMRLQVEEREIDEILIIEGDEKPIVSSIHQQESHFATRLAIEYILRNQYLEHVMLEENLLPEVMNRLLVPVEFQDEAIRSQDDMLQSFWISYAFSFALYTILISSGSSIATSVMTEKLTRVMEVMISKVKPSVMMFSKISSTLVSVLMSTVAMVVPFLLAEWLGWSSFLAFLDNGMPLLNWATMGIGLAFLLLGYLLYGMLFAAAGAVSSDVESLGVLIAPLISALIVPFVVPMFLPEYSVILAIASYVPFFTPFVTFGRFVSGHVNLLELIITLTLLVVTISILGHYAMRLYINGVQHYSDSLSLKDVRRLLSKKPDK